MGVNTAVTLNGFDLDTLGFKVQSVTGPGAAPGNRWATQTLPTRAGLVLLDGRPLVTTRPIVVTGTLKAATMPAFWSALDELKSRCTAGAIELQTIDQTDRYFLVRMNDQPHTPMPPQFLNAFATVVLQFEALDPYGYSVNPVVVSCNSTKAPLPLGSGPVAPLLRVMGPATNPVLTYRNVRGDVAQTLTLTVTLLATDYLDIDCAAKTVTKYTSGVASSLLSALAGSDFLVVTPEDGDYATAAWPTLEISAGSLAVIYRKAWN